uniref:Uncharacterized protein n=1 Tax=Timema shepardi TaxID=629360 RepID=A0A7R9G4R4_TIMSH|nr:unnamed protein product [Timema shepardi]
MRPEGSAYMIPQMEYDEQPISRTYQYRKVMKPMLEQLTNGRVPLCSSGYEAHVMKPMLERKRRARINRCLDELKELMVSALQAEGENVSKLEKADILELTVRHLHKLRAHRSLRLTPEAAYADRFRAGFTHCAAEVSQYIASTVATPAPVDAAVGAKLLQHLGSCIRRMDTTPVASPSPVGAPQSYGGAYTPPASPQDDATSVKMEEALPVWRPW